VCDCFLTMNSAVKFVVFAAIICAATANLEEEFDAWAKKFGKTYESAAERNMRMKIFDQNKAKIAQLNAKSTSEVYGINAFADRTHEELTATYTSSLAGVNFKGLGMKVEHYVPRANVSHHPDNFDWSWVGLVSSVKDQGQCGSCWAFSACGVMEAQLYMKKSELIELSPQYLVDCDNDCIDFDESNNKVCDNGCNGGLPAIAFQHVIDNGISTLADYPYTAQDGTCDYDSSSLVTGWHHWNVVSFDSEEDIIDYLALYGPLSVLIHSEELFYYTGGVFNGDCETQYDHAVLLTGWGVTDDGTPYWIIKNSWGKSWGMDGYLHLIRGKNKCGFCTFITTIHMG